MSEWFRNKEGNEEPMPSPDMVLKFMDVIWREPVSVATSF